jgi:sensitive to high expression protein 9
MTTAIALKETELAADKAFSDLMQAILQRYHEEQVWSDKIRNVSTYAGLTGLLVNLVVFVGAIAFVEPWKRKRLVERLEERIAGMMEQVEGSIDGLGQKVEKDLAVIRNQSGASALVDTTETGSADLDHEVTFDDLSTPIPMSMPSPWPILTRSLQRVSPLLDRVAEPSHDRDIAFSAGIGAVLGVTITALSMWMGR